MLHLTHKKLDNNQLQARCPAALWHVEVCSLCRGHVVQSEADLSEHRGMYKYVHKYTLIIESYKLASGIGFLLSIFLVDAFNRPALTSLTAIKMHNS